MAVVEEEIVKLQDVHMYFDGIKALQGLNLSINAGHIYGILGHNGAGKTTTLRLIIGLLKPTHGSISVFDLNPVKNPVEVKKRVGMLTEDVGLYDNLSAYDNLKFFGKIYKIPERELEERIKYLLTRAELWDKKDLVVKGFSRGMKKKTAIVRAMLNKPKLLLLDEPSNGLDPVSTGLMHEDIKRLVSNENISVILSTHNLDEAKKLCDEVCIIKNGKNILSIDLKNYSQNNRNMWFTITSLQQLESYKTLQQLFMDLKDIVLDYNIEETTLEVKVKKKEDISLVIRRMLEMDILIYKVIPNEYDLEKIYSELHEV